ncbi:MAG: hypothetical protein ACRCY7_06700 [Cetobacterium sp.]|uniref:hypothetical protein n=1 Tax=Cetobacterium sp. TaxID=2071632 RepID=UPI003F3262B1
MLKKTKEKHHREMLNELDEVILDKEYIIKDESPYLVDYLYGVSDIDSKIEEYLDETGLDEEWIMFYRCLINKEVLNSDEYDKLKIIGEALFLMRNENDLEKFKNDDVTKDLNKIKDDTKEILEKLLNFIKNKENNPNLTEDNLFDSEDIKGEFVGFIKEHNALRSEEEKEKNIYKMDKFLKNAFSNKKIKFNKTDFFKEILGLNKSKINSIQNKYKKEKK